MRIDKDKTCCFTGHRPEKIEMAEEKIHELLEKEIKLAINLCNSL